MPDPIGYSDRLTSFTNLLLAINHDADLTLFDMENFILRNMDMFKRDITLRCYNPLHNVSFFSTGKTAEGLLRHRVCKWLININRHKWATYFSRICKIAWLFQGSLQIRERFMYMSFAYQVKEWACHVHQTSQGKFKPELHASIRSHRLQDITILEQDRPHCTFHCKFNPALIFGDFVRELDLSTKNSPHTTNGCPNLPHRSGRGFLKFQ